MNKQTNYAHTLSIRYKSSNHQSCDGLQGGWQLMVSVWGGGGGYKQFIKPALLQLCQHNNTTEMHTKIFNCSLYEIKMSNVFAFKKKSTQFACTNKRGKKKTLTPIVGL